LRGAMFYFDFMKDLRLIICMLKLIALSLLVSSPLLAQTKFPLGNGVDKWGVPLKVPESELSLRLGARFQSLATIQHEDGETEQDFQARRVRFQLEATLDDIKFNMDIRNDRANADDNGEETFNVGDA